MRLILPWKIDPKFREMKPDAVKPDQVIGNAFRALRRGDMRAARRWAHQAVVLAPTLEDSWLALAAVATPRGSVEYLAHALEINPGSQRATSGMRWALERLQREKAAGAAHAAFPHHAADLPPYVPHGHGPFSQIPHFLVYLGVPLLALAALALSFWTIWAIIGPTVLAFAQQSDSQPIAADSATLAPTQALSSTPLLSDAPTLAATSTSIPIPTQSPEPTTAPTHLPVPTQAPTSVPTHTPAPTQAPAVPLSGKTYIVQPGDTLSDIAEMFGVSTQDLIQANHISDPSVIMPGQTLALPKSSSGSSATISSGSGSSVGIPAAPAGAKSILVKLSQQHLYAYQGGTLVYSFVISSGRSAAPTLVGTFSILDKISQPWSSAYGFWMPDWMGIYWVSPTLENGIHALPVETSGETIWGNSLGTPISYGCIVLGTQNAKQLFNWADIGTPVTIRY